MTPGDFIDLCRQLRDLGATAVRAGEYEASFAPTPIALPEEWREAVRAGRPASAKPETPEQAEEREDEEYVP